MKRISIIAVISISITLGVVIAGHQGNNNEKAGWNCYSSSCQSYEVIEAESLDILKERVKKGLDKAGWQPHGGIVYNSDSKHYLQVMVHPRKLPSYP